MSSPRSGQAPDRFAPPKACVIAPAVGPSVMGLPDRPSKATLRTTFEEGKALLNEESSNKINGQFTGLRFRAAQEFKKSHPTSSFTCNYDREPGNKIRPKVSPTFLTQENHPLHMKDQGDVPHMHGDGSHIYPPKFGKRTYAHNQHLDCSLLPDQEQPYRGLQQGKRQILKTLQQVEGKQDMEVLELQLLREYPHGIPKRILQDLRQCSDGLSCRTNLGFGLSD